CRLLKAAASGCWNRRSIRTCSFPPVLRFIRRSKRLCGHRSRRDLRANGAWTMPCTMPRPRWRRYWRSKLSLILGQSSAAESADDPRVEIEQRKNSKMKAAVLEDVAKLVVRNIPDPPLETSEVRLAVKAVGVCGTDLHLFRGHGNYHLDARGKPIPLT